LRRAVKSIALVVALGCGPDPVTESTPAAPGPLSQPQRPRIVVLISLDTLRPDHLGVYGYDRLTSPVIDGLGREGAVFEDASTTSPWTLPSHASMLTGLYPNRHGAVDWEAALDVNLPTLASHLSSRGYLTAAVVNTLHLSERFGLPRGFEKFSYVKENEERVSPSTWVTDQAIEWLEQFRDRPVFLFLHYYDVHSRYAALPRYERQFVSPYDGPADGSSGQLYLYLLSPEFISACQADPDQESCRTWAKRPILSGADAQQQRVDFDQDDLRHLLDLYDAGVRQTDAELGRLVHFLRTERLLDEALVIVTSDHGEQFLEHGSVLHSRTHYQEVMSVPLIMRGPGIPAGSRISTPVSLVDVVPTILAALGESEALETDGLDLSALWQSAGPADAARFRDRALFSEADASNVLLVARHGRYKLHYNRLTGEEELYDLELDPGEQTNLAERDPTTAGRLRGLLTNRLGDGRRGEAVELTPEEAERLRALGYLR
jgi:arylsulfatase A-like enzyme